MLVCHAGPMGLQYDAMYNIADDNVIDQIKELAPNVTSVISRIFVSMLHQFDADTMQPTITEEGICYTFNMISADEMFTNVYDVLPLICDCSMYTHILFSSTSIDFRPPQSGRPTRNWNFARTSRQPPDFEADSIVTDTYPMVLHATGREGYNLFLFALIPGRPTANCDGPGFGFRIHLHDPLDYPKLRNGVYDVRQLNEVTMLYVRPQVVNADADALRALAPEKCVQHNNRTGRFSGSILCFPAGANAISPTSIGCDSSGSTRSPTASASACPSIS